MSKDFQDPARPEGLHIVTDKAVIEAFLRRDMSLYAYSLGDLDDFFWPYTAWYGWYGRGKLLSLFLLYRGTGLSPVLLALEERERAAAAALLGELLPRLPQRFYSHASPYLGPALAGRASVESHGLYSKMSLVAGDRLGAGILPEYPARPVLAEDLPAIMELYGLAYPANWFDRRMLETGKYQGAFCGSRLIAIAGVHVYSKRYGIATLGNITTHPDFRGKGLGASITATVCEDLLKDVGFIGLNVKADNRAAIRCYEKIGFKAGSNFEEFMVTNPAAGGIPHLLKYSNQDRGQNY